MTPEQRFEEIKSLYDNEQYEKALPLLQALAGEGYAPAQHELAELYYHGWGRVKEDHAKAAEWYRKAAEQKDADSQYELGERYYNGEGVAQDREEAAKWYGRAVEYYSKAAEEGDINAQNMLAICLDYGRGIAQDHAKALEWWRKAAANGHYGANRRLEMLKPDEEKDRFQQAVSSYDRDHYDEALPMFEALAAGGHTGAMVYLGYCYAYGEGVEQDKDKAVWWYRKAAKQGDEYAQGLLDELEGTKKESSMCERCRSGGEQIYCEVCTYLEDI